MHRTVLSCWFGIGSFPGSAQILQKSLLHPLVLQQNDVLHVTLYIVGKFNWKGTIKAILKQAPDNEIAVKKLKKKVWRMNLDTAGEMWFFILKYAVLWVF